MQQIDLNTVLLVVVALTNLVTAVVASLTHRTATRTELNTNSMKDALVAVTAKSSRAEGVLEGFAAGVAEGKKSDK